MVAKSSRSEGFVHRGVTDFSFGLVCGITLLGLGILSFYSLFTDIPLPEEGTLEESEGPLVSYELDPAFRRGLDGIRFTLADGTNNTYYFPAWAGDEVAVHEGLEYALVSIHDPAVKILFDPIPTNADSGREYRTYEIAVGEEMLATLAEARRIDRENARFAPLFSSAFVLLGLFFFRSAYRHRKDNPDDWENKVPSGKGRRGYQRLRLHRVFGPVERWFN